MALPILQLGTQHDAVVQLRTKLAQLGFSISAPTTELAVYDSAVQQAVSAFQASVGLTADGIVGPDTWMRLGADPSAVPSSGWGRILLMAVIGGGLWWWWKKRRANGEFSRRMNGYGDAVDTTLIEEPLLLMERGDCNGAARLLMKRRTYVAGASTPKNSQLFKRVARQVVAHCGREVEPLVREAMKAEERETRYPNVMTDLEQKMRAKRKMVRRTRDESDLEPYLTAQPTIRRGLRPIDTEPQRYVQRGRPVLYPDVRGSRGGKIVFVENGREVIGRTVGRDDPSSSYVMVEAGGRRQNILKTRIKRFIPHYGPKRASEGRMKKVMSPAQRAAEAARSKENRMKATALRKEAARLENEAMRRAARVRAEREGGVWLKRQK